MKRKFGFTLSEVLISMVIIGIIAAMTIPSLMQNINKNEYKATLKKNYSTFAGAFNMLSDYHFNEDFEDWDYGHNNAFTKYVFDKLSNHIAVSKVCGRVFENNECFAPVKAKNGKPAWFFTERGFASNFAHLYTFVLNDGSSVALDVWYEESITQYAGVWKDLIVGSDNIVVLIDVNGMKKPNMLGRDVHMFVLTSKGLVPAGTDDKSKYCDNKSVTYNYDCTARFMKEH